MIGWHFRESSPTYFSFDDMAANKLLKVIFILFQSFFILLGVGLIASGSWLEIRHQSFRILITSRDLQYGPYIIIAAGCAIFLVSVIGMVGACCETKINKFLLAFYIILVALVFVAQIAGGITAFIVRNQAEGITRTVLNTTFYYYGVNTTESIGNTTAWDAIQMEFKCCGINTPQDWVNNPNRTSLTYDYYPKSCCNRNTTVDCGDFRGVATRNFYTQGCQEAILDFINYNLLVVAIIGIVFLLGEVMVIAMAICLVCVSDFDD